VLDHILYLPPSNVQLQTEVKKHVMKAALKKGVETGTLVPVKASYKLSADAKKAAPKTKAAPKKKAAAPKKETAAKKVNLSQEYE
jgi:hypothetical protein